MGRGRGKIDENMLDKMLILLNQGTGSGFITIHLILCTAEIFHVKKKKEGGVSAKRMLVL